MENDMYISKNRGRGSIRGTLSLRNVKTRNGVLGPAPLSGMSATAERRSLPKLRKRIELFSSNPTTHTRPHLLWIQLGSIMGSSFFLWGYGRVLSPSKG